MAGLFEILNEIAVLYISGSYGIAKSILFFHIPVPVPCPIYTSKSVVKLLKYPRQKRLIIMRSMELQYALFT
jgi:hypothetical protein